MISAGPMELFLERRFQPGLSIADLHGAAATAAACLGYHRVEWLESRISLDGRRLLCRFRAPDLESARTALRQAGADTSALWPGSCHGTERPDTANVLVERRFEEAVTLAYLEDRERAGGWCLEMHDTVFIRTFFSRDRRRMICLYRAPDAEAVRRAQQQIGMPVERVWAFHRVTRDDPPPVAAPGE